MILWDCPFCDTRVELASNTEGSTMTCHFCGMESLVELPPVRTPTRAEQNQIANIPVVGTETLTSAGFEIVQHKPIVFSRRVYGINVLAEAMISVKDMLGGRSERLEKAIAHIQRELWDDIRTQAIRSGANAVVRFDCHISNLSSSGTTVLCGVAHGTPVVIRPAGASVEKTRKTPNAT